MASDRRPSRPASRRVPAAFLALGCLLVAACSAAPAASGPSPSASAAAPAVTSPTPSLSLVTPGPSKPSGPDAAATYTGVLSFDSIEGGCAYLQTAVGRKLEVIYPEGWTLEKSPLELHAPDGSIHSRAGDTVTVKGTEATDMASICQIGSIIRATEVLDR
jgi:hypothetical protein